MCMVIAYPLCSSEARKIVPRESSLVGFRYGSFPGLCHSHYSPRRSGVHPLFDGLWKRILNLHRASGQRRDLGVGQVAARIVAEPVAGRRLGARAQVAVADRKEAAGLAALRQELFAVTQDRQTRVRHARPGRAEGPLPDVAAVIVPTELIVMDVADRVDGGDVAAGAVASRSLQALPHDGGAGRVALLQLQQQIGRI